jgi:prevent-host-death family protein
MKTLPIKEIKSNFSKILDEVKHGEEIAISYGKKKEKIAVLVPFSKYEKMTHRKLGLLENKASFKIRDDFSLSDEELLNS